MRRRPIELLGIGILLLALLPFLVLCFYNHPLGTHEWDWISDWAGQFSGVGFWEEQVYWYHDVGGRYFSTALLSTTAQWYTLPRFQALFLGNLVLMIASLYGVVRAALPFLPRLRSWGITLLLLVVYLTGLTNIYESIYRFTVVVIYQLGWILTLVLVRLLIRNGLARTPGVATGGAIGLLVLLIVGTNEISMAMLHLLFGVVGIAMYRRTGRVAGWLLLGYGLLVAASLFTALAPGNAQRHGSMAVELDGVRALVLTTVITGFLWLKWLSSTLLLPLLFAVAYFGQRAGAQLRRYALFGQPWLSLIATLVLVPAVFFPFLLATGGQAFPERIVDLLFFSILLGSVLTTLSWVASRPIAVAYELPLLGKVLGASFLVAAIFFGGLSFDRRQDIGPVGMLDRVQLGSPVGVVWRTWLSGRAAAYDRAVRRQYTAIRNCRNTLCEVAPPPVFPQPLYDAIYDRRDDRYEPFMGYYFNQRKQRIRYRKTVD